MTINIDEQIKLELVEGKHAQGIFQMVNNNRNYLRQWLPFVDSMQTVDFAINFVNGTVARNKDGIEFAFVILYNNEMIGRVGVYKIDNKNGIGEIGYWIIEDSQGKGIVTKACKVLIDYCFSTLKLNRIEIRCGTENLRSKAIPEKLNFKQEGIIRQGELLHDKFIDLYLYSLLKADIK